MLINFLLLLDKVCIITICFFFYILNNSLPVVALPWTGNLPRLHPHFTPTQLDRRENISALLQCWVQAMRPWNVDRCRNIRIYTLCASTPVVTPTFTGIGPFTFARNKKVSCHADIGHDLPRMLQQAMVCCQAAPFNLFAGSRLVFQVFLASYSTYKLDQSNDSSALALRIF